MLLDAQDLSPGSRLEADVCVVGAGAAGIALARELAASRLAVVVLESGGFAYEEAVQGLYAGRTRGTLLPPKNGYLLTSRLRYFGGTTNHWNGYCRPLDPEDFVARDWVAGSGWPITGADLDAYYRRAVDLVQVTPYHYDPATIGRQPHLLAGDAGFETTFFHLSPPTRFAQAYRPDLEAAANVRVVLHANATRLAAEPNGRRLAAVEVAGPGDRRFTVAARATVLAGGGIENARLLLASRDVQRRGLGNDRDLVGRYFMDHPAVTLGGAVLPYWRRLMETYDAHFPKRVAHRIRGALHLRGDFQRQRRLLNAAVLFQDVVPQRSAWPELAAEVSWLATDVAQLAEGHGDPARGTQYFGRVELVGEQVPDPANRVTLTDETDALGVPRPALDWRIGEQDEASLRAAAEWLVRRLGEELRGRLQLDIEGETLWERTRWSNHHIGTTRMAAAPDRGVVDADCKVHGVDGLYVAGSSVFPTSGCSNPTLTLLALALRLADHLTERLA